MPGIEIALEMYAARRALKSGQTRFRASRTRVTIDKELFAQGFEFDLA